MTGGKRSWNWSRYCCCSVLKSCLTVPLCPNGLQHDTLPCPSPAPSFLKSMSIESMILSDHLILCCPLLLFPSVFPSIRVLSNQSALQSRWPKHWSFSFSISPSNEYSGLIPLGLTGLISLQSKRLLRVFSSTTVWKHQFFSPQLSFWSNSHIWTWLLQNHIFDYMDICQQSDVSAFKYAIKVCHSLPSKEQAS